MSPRRSGSQAQAVAVVDEDVDGVGDNELRPGAMRVRDQMDDDNDSLNDSDGLSRMSYDYDSDSRRISYHYDSDWTEEDEPAVPTSERTVEPESLLLQADVLDEDALTARYRSIARRKIEARIQVEAPEAIVMTMPTTAQTRRKMLCYWCLVIVFAGIVVPSFRHPAVPSFSTS